MSRGGHGALRVPRGLRGRRGGGELERLAVRQGLRHQQMRGVAARQVRGAALHGLLGTAAVGPRLRGAGQPWSPAVGEAFRVALRRCRRRFRMDFHAPTTVQARAGPLRQDQLHSGPERHPEAQPADLDGGDRRGLPRSIPSAMPLNVSLEPENAGFQDVFSDTGNV